ncbi:MAG: magnesium transporter [Candidatus Aenigmarchaeota archaeon]|nr:magnesium transporter [Candidatus Aenigmarchaeota archaeon]MDI6722704.1 magnesium transporter [Candidatus Aenigmarchaeota archaeon]
MGNDFREILVVEIISVTGGLIAGLALATFTNQILLVPGLFILIPGFLEMRGNLGGSMAARLSSGLFLGVVKPKMKDKIAKSNMIATALLIIATSFILGVFAYLASTYFFGIENVKLIFISVIAGFMSILMTPLTVYTTFWVFRKGHDPNNVMGPYITTLGDVVSVASFMIAIMVVA